MIRKRAISASLCVLLLSGCLTPTGTQNPAQVVQYGVRGGAGSTGMHTVLAGDTVYTVSRQYNLPLRDIIAVNHLSPPYRLSNGFRLKLPPPNEYVVKSTDTLNRLSRMFDVSVSEMARLNNLSDPYILKKGQVIRLPSPQPKLDEEFAAVPSPSPSSGPVATEVLAPPMKIGAVESEVLAPPPDVEASTAVTPAPVSGSVPVQTAAVTPTPAASGFPPQPQARAAAQVQPAAAPATTSAAVSAAIDKPPPRSGRFMRPVDGKIVSGFGPKPDGLHNDGINIKAPRGTAVRAAENGVVAYTGSGMSGYGNLVLIRHDGRWMTAYAHMDKVLVKRGDMVKAGQSIGTVGTSGQVDSPQLHFEIRKGTEAVNPDTYL